MTEDIADLLDTLNIAITSQSHSGKTGDLIYRARCPHHKCMTPKGKPHTNCSITEDFDPGWDINSDTGQHHCHSCGFGGSLEWLIHIMTGVPMSEAAATSGKGARALTKVLKRDPWGGERPQPLPPMNEARLKMYGRPPTWAMAKRHLSPEAVEWYDIRWADPFLFGKDRTPYSNCWITPIRDPRTNAPWGMQVKQETGDRFFRNLPGAVPKGSTLFGYNDNVAGGNIIVTESPLDAAYAWSLGYPAVSSMGAQVTDIQMELLIEKWDIITLALDDDEAGNKSRNRLVGLDPDGRINYNLTDYSRRVQIDVVDYSRAKTWAKDIGDMTPEDATWVIAYAFRAFRLQMRPMDTR